jgi:hypothetical protein
VRTMASSQAIALRGSPFAFGAHLVLSLITLCMVFDILSLPTFASAIPINHLAHRRDDSGSTEPSVYHRAL